MTPTIPKSSGPATSSARQSGSTRTCSPTGATSSRHTTEISAPVRVAEGPLRLHGLSVEGVNQCVHCGLCLAYCPTFSELGTEMDSPRGRIVLIKSLAMTERPVTILFYFGVLSSLMALGLVAAVVLASGSVLKAIAMVFLGLLFGLVGTDVNTGAQRFTFDIPELSDGIDFAPIAMGLFGIAEIVINLEKRMSRSGAIKVTSLFPTREETRRAIPAAIRGTALGAILGVLPGGGPTLGAFSSYTLEKKISRNPGEFGKGAVEGVAAPEAANNAAAQTSFIPMLTLGIPSNAVMALMVGAMIIQGIQPGPEVMTKKPDLFWGMIASMWIGNLMLVILNLPLIGMWVQFLKIPYRVLFPSILLFIAIGAYSINNSPFEVYMAAMFGFFGYYASKWGCEAAPLILGFVLGPMMEENFRRSLLLSRGAFSVFVTRPLSLGLLIAAAILVAIVAMPSIKAKREVAFQEE